MRTPQHGRWSSIAVVLAAGTASVLVHAQSVQCAGAAERLAYEPARTPWGDPDLQGDFTNSDESLIPMERPEALTGRRLEEISDAELGRLVDERNAARDEADRQRWELRSPLHWFENIKPKNSRAWLVIDPPDGRIPPLTADARARAAARTEARKGRGEADSWEDRSLYDRCITRGMPGSMMPAIYGNCVPHRAGAGRGDHLLRDGQRDARHPARWAPAPRRARCAPTWATRAAASRVRRWWWRRRTSPTRRRTADRATGCG